MSTRTSENRMVWLIIGTVFGMALSYYCPHEPAYADSAAMGEKFAMCTVPTDPLNANSEAIFVLDMVTGRLLGAAQNSVTNSFTQTFARNLAQDFGVVENAQYVMVPGRVVMRSTGPIAPASGAIYVGELTSGVVIMYGFNYIQAQRPIPTQTLSVVDRFPWRESSR